MKNDKALCEANANHRMSRREFTALSLAASVAAATGAAHAAAAVSESDVEVRTPDGVCDAALFHPQGQGSWPAVIVYPDALGLRPATRDVGRRLAADGYAVLVPNPYYRSTKAPGIEPNFDFSNPDSRAKLTALRVRMTPEGIGQDASAFVAFLDSQAFVNQKARVGVVGYCMGGAMSMRAAAAVPSRIGAGASFHGSALATDKPESPHLLVPKTQAQYYFGVAADDDERDPEAKNKLAEAYQAASLPAKIEVYEGALHGWCMKDMPAASGKPIYNEAQAERAWGELTALFKRALA